MALSTLSTYKVSLIGALILCDLGKQVCNYGMRYYSKTDEYPIPQSLLVAMLEIIKFTIVFVRTGGKLPSLSTPDVIASLPFMAPSLIYVMSNNVYYLGITLVTPPIWAILISIKTTISALTYKYVLKRPVTNEQILGSLIMALSVLVTKLSDLRSQTSQTPTLNEVSLSAIFVALLMSTLSVGGGIVTEKLFKDKARPNGGPKFSFMDQQLWMYFYGVVLNLTVFYATNTDYTMSEFLFNMLYVTWPRWPMMFTGIMATAIQGMVVASVLKNFDNVVKEYTYLAGNILISIVCSKLYPDKFEFDGFIILSLALLFAGIYIYEGFSEKNKAKKRKQEQD